MDGETDSEKSRGLERGESEAGREDGSPSLQWPREPPEESALFSVEKELFQLGKAVLGEGS